MRVLASLLIAAGCLLVVPVGASAATYTVDSIADDADLLPGTGGCLTVGGKCTLRAAIEESNFSTGVPDEIKFSSAFDGQPADTIVPLTALPAIKDPVSVLGGDCFGEDGPDAPCAGIKGPSGAAALTVEDANGVVIEGLAITGAQFGIDVVSGSEGFVARNDWIGLNLSAAKEANLTGIFLDPGSDGATIGGLAATERNVIAGNEGDGLDLNGASDATIQGNYFGVNPPGPVGLPGGSQQIANGKDIEITDSTSGGGVKAENNEVGATIEDSALTKPACDGGCNVISGANGAGIDLNGDGSGQNEAPASGPTTVHGNYVGLGGDGETVVQNAAYGVLAGAADHVQVGGTAEGDANFVAGGGEGIVSESGGEDFEALGNKIGFAVDGSEATPPTTRGIFVLALSVTEPASIEDNDIRMAGGVGIEQRFQGARIIDNNLEGGSVGIWTKVEPGGGLIAGNVVEAPEEFGILVESPDNEIRRNSVFNSGKAGIRVKNPPGIAMTGDLIGGDTAERENVIEGSGGPAIEILEEALEPGSFTEIARNRGSANKGLFIDLVNGANEGILPPTFGAAKQTEASGSGAEPGALIRVFRKKSAEAGELESFLGEATADGKGNWKATYLASIPGGTIVAATQTSVEGGTSELSTATTAAEPSGGGGTGSGGGAGKDDKPKTKAPKGGKNKGGALDTTILKGPKGKIHSTTAKFKFSSNEKGAKFECKLDRKPFKPCKSPKTYKKLKLGKHVFKVRAVKGKDVDPTPAKRKFKVLK